MESTTLGEVLNSTTAEPGYDSVPVNIAGIAGVVGFYLLILGIGIFASWKSKSLTSENTEEVIIAGRNIGLVVGIFTMTATWVGGGYINGTAEVVYSSGLVWCQAPVGYAISLTLGGLFFAKQMRSKGYVTMLDPFEEKFGKGMTSILFLPALTGEIFWSGAILSALGGSLTVILGLQHWIAVIVSAVIAVFYTLAGGLYSVAYTDVVQLICIFLGLWLGFGFSVTNPAVDPITDTAGSTFNNITNTTDYGWLGVFPTDAWLGNWIDYALLLIFGGIPWQVYFQRVLSSKSASKARALSFVASFGCLVMAVPALLIGAVGKSARWDETDLAKYEPTPPTDAKLILPLVLNYLCPKAVAVIGLGAVSAAVMSSADSSILSASSMFAKNVYPPIRYALCCKRQASEKEIIWILRISIVSIGVLAAAIAIFVDSIYGLWYLCSDLVYVILFPQFVCVVHVNFVNTYGSLSGFIVGLVFRLTGGEPLLFLPPAIKYPYYIDETQLFPFRTLAMLLNFFTIIVVSALANCIFNQGNCSLEFDIFNCYSNAIEDTASFKFDRPQNGTPSKPSNKSGENPGYVEDDFDVIDTHL